MRRRKTTTQKLHNALSNNLFYITKVEIYHKSSHQTNVIEAEKFKEYFDFFCEAEIFADVIGWHYEADIKEKGYYIAETGRMVGDSDGIIIAHFKVNDSMSADDVEKILSIKYESEE